MRRDYSLDNKYTLEAGSAYMSGIQALVRLPVEQMRQDRRAGRHTGCFISGYEGSKPRRVLLEEHQLASVIGVDD